MTNINNLRDFVTELKSAGARIIAAEKIGAVLAREGKEGEILTVWTQNGNMEGTETVHKGEVILTRVDDDGQPAVDKYGHVNSWKVSKDVFAKKYDTEHPDERGVVKPAGGVQHFIQVDRDISFTAPWGEVQNINKGGYLNITSPNDIYGIAREEFHITYKLIE